MNIRRGGEGLVILLAVQHRGISGMATCNEKTQDCDYLERDLGICLHCAQHGGLYDIGVFKLY